MSTHTEIEPAKAESQLVPTPKREIRVVEDHGPLAYIMDSGRFEHMFRIASVMAGASLIPEHMWKNKSGELALETVKANCFLVVNQAFRWGMDPFAVVPETYVVGGKLGFQGKLIAAVINAKAGLEHDLDYEFSGKVGTDDFQVRVFATKKGESKPREITLTVGQGKTSNDMWRKDAEQKLCYSGATKWARRHSPQTILGILTDDDIDRIMENQGPAVKAAKVVLPIFKEKPTAAKTSLVEGSTAATVEDAVDETLPAGATTREGEPPTLSKPDPESGPEAKLAELMRINDIDFATMLPHLPRGMAPRNAKGLDDMTHENLRKVIADFAVIVDIVKAERKQVP